jgi:hypothetical protein
MTILQQFIARNCTFVITNCGSLPRYFENESNLPQLSGEAPQFFKTLLVQPQYSVIKGEHLKKLQNC